MARDKTNPNDAILDAMCHKQGDVVVVVPDGHPWTEKEKTNPDWRIIRVPNLPNDLQYQATEPGPEKPGMLKQRNKYTLDLTSPHVTTAFQQYFADNTRAQAIYETSLPTQNLYDLRKERPDRSV